MTLTQRLWSEITPSDRRLIAIQGIDALLRALGLDVHERLRIVSARGPTDRQRRLVLNKEYRSVRSDISRAMSIGGIVRPEVEGPLRERTERIESVGRLFDGAVKTLHCDLLGLGGSHLHMHVNRMLPAPSNEKEQTLCHFMAKDYRSQVARLPTEQPRTEVKV